MKSLIKREDDFQERRKHIANLTEEQLEERFWKLAEEIVEPLVDLAYKNTSPSIERSILLRMGFSSIECTAIVDGAIERGLLGKGAGHLVYRLAKEKNMSIRDAGLKLAEGEMWDDLLAIFKGGAE
ncbi:ornithine aminomutase subunit alpha [Anaerosalibacter massiliensis]|uniref:Ornithine aminomutase subunit alpha n=1 Tax=Anaerosalibacter massiliensis TaxID=1347392 RepID=A0A9X2S435_9FIRM|nr:ornithine aminomutase subunit alpha [Anaerosalibacter massiliensis]MCR2042869.1 ornithine aminomutase subunit alpha [Anaerosalibacter massiliensis]